MKGNARIRIQKEEVKSVIKLNVCVYIYIIVVILVVKIVILSKYPTYVHARFERTNLLTIPKNSSTTYELTYNRIYD